MLLIWEITKGMSEGIYSEGDIFENCDMGNIIIYEGELVWSDTMCPLSVVINDKTIWEKIY